MAETIANYVTAWAPCDFVLFNYVAQLPDEPPAPIAMYDFLVVQMPLRSVIPDAVAFRLPDTEQACEQVWRDCCDRVDLFLEACLHWNRQHGTLCFVSNFLVPQSNSLGRLLPRYDFRNIVHFVEELNRHLAAKLSSYANVYLLDIDAISATMGRGNCQNDVIYQFNHGALLPNDGADQDWVRLEPMASLEDLYTTRSHDFLMAVVSELEGMFAAFSNTDKVKAVVVDFDDTIWRGVYAEGDYIEPWLRTEGWPSGFVEALLVLKRRGILLAGISKNTQETIEAAWPSLYGGRLELSDFASLKVNWRTKKENLLEILQEFNIRADSVVFVDDNPVERAEIEEAFPGVRSIGRHPYTFRRVLLWSPETQFPVLTEESMSRTQMIQRQIKRDVDRKTMSRDDFLQKLNIEVTPSVITDATSPLFDRALELINKTNQFNTTGERWASSDLRKVFASPGAMYCFSVKDCYTSYGLVAVLIVENTNIRQFVMSCRVIGLGVEAAALSFVLETMKAQGSSEIHAVTRKTQNNHLSQNIFEAAGFSERSNGVWSKSLDMIARTSDHIRLGTAAHPENRTFEGLLATARN